MRAVTARVYTSARQVFAALNASDFRIALAVIQAVLDRFGE